MPIMGDNDPNEGIDRPDPQAGPQNRTHFMGTDAKPQLKAERHIKYLMYPYWLLQQHLQQTIGYISHHLFREWA